MINFHLQEPNYEGGGGGEMDRAHVQVIRIKVDSNRRLKSWFDTKRKKIDNLGKKVRKSDNQSKLMFINLYSLL